MLLWPLEVCLWIMLDDVFAFAFMFESLCKQVFFMQMERDKHLQADQKCFPCFEGEIPDYKWTWYTHILLIRAVCY